MLFISVLAGAMVLRISFNQYKAFWFDEVGTLDLSSVMSLERAIDYEATNDIHPVGFIILLRLWIMLCGNSVPATRMLSVLFILAVGVLLFIWLWKKGYKLPAWIAYLWTVIFPFPVYYSIEARPYAMMFFLGTLLAIITIELLMELRRSMIYAMAAVCAVSLHIHYMMGLVIFGAFSCLIGKYLRRPRELIAVVLMGVMPLLIFAPWVPVVLRQIPIQQSFNHFKPLESNQLYLFFKALGPTFIGESKIHHAGAVLLIVILALSCLTLVWKRSNFKFPVWSLIVIFAAPLLLLFIVSLRMQLIVTRNMVSIMPAAVLIIALGASAWGRILRIIAPVALLVLALFDLPAFQNPDDHVPCEKAVKFLKKNLKPGEGFMTMPEYNELVLQYHFNRKGIFVPWGGLSFRWLHVLLPDSEGVSCDWFPIPFSKKPELMGLDTYMQLKHYKKKHPVWWLIEYKTRHREEATRAMLLNGFKAEKQKQVGFMLITRFVHTGQPDFFIPPEKLVKILTGSENPR